MSKIFKHVLLIEDDGGHALIIKRSLSEFCEAVTRVDCMQAASESFDGELYDLIVTDLNLPDAIGVEGVTRVVSFANDIPVIVLTSSTLLQEAIGAMKVGARDYIVKNFDGSFHELLGLSLSRVYATEKVQQERKQFERELRIMQRAINNSNDGLAVVNEKGEVLYANPALEQIIHSCGGSDAHNVLALASERVRGSEEVRARLQQAIAELEEGGAWQTELVIDGQETCVYECSVAVMAEGDRAERRCVVWLRDQSELKSRERFQRDIISTTTHDLKGPLGAILLSSDLLCRLTTEGEKPHTLAQRMGTSARGALDIIDEFLSARSLQEGTLVLKPVSHSLVTLVNTVISDYDTAAASRGVTLESAINQPLDITVDKLGFVRVLSNLLSNAIKFSSNGDTVHISALASDSEVVVSVEDEGLGMEPAQIQKAFGRFGRLEQDAEIQGTGLGLYVVKSIVDAHGGRIDVQSQPGKGTRISVVFPLSPPVDEAGQLISLAFR